MIARVFRIVKLFQTPENVRTYMEVDCDVSFVWVLDVVREVITFWKTNKEHIYIPNYRDGLFKITQPTAEEMASFR